MIRSRTSISRKPDVSMCMFLASRRGKKGYYKPRCIFRTKVTWWRNSTAERLEYEKHTDSLRLVHNENSF